MPPKRKATNNKDETAASDPVNKPKKTKTATAATDISKDSGSVTVGSGSGAAGATKSKGKGKKKDSSDVAGGSGENVGGGGSPALTKASIPKKNKTGHLDFEDYPRFRPNLTPKEVMQLGSFGGTYFRPIHSSVTNKSYRGAWKEFPKDWFEGLNIEKQVANRTYLNSVNKYGVHCGGDLHMWESSGWMRECDPYGWFQWYCRFYLGRRCDDDERQISRGLKVFGPTGRWRTQLCNLILVKGADVDDETISPKIRQLLQHWGYRVTETDLRAHAKKSIRG